MIHVVNLVIDFTIHEYPGRIQWGYSESTVGYSEDTVRVHCGTMRVQLGYSGNRREKERVRRGEKEDTLRVQGGYSGDTVRVQWGTVRI